MREFATLWFYYAQLFLQGTTNNARFTFSVVTRTVYNLCCARQIKLVKLNTIFSVVWMLREMQPCQGLFIAMHIAKHPIKGTNFPLIPLFVPHMIPIRTITLWKMATNQTLSLTRSDLSSNTTIHYNHGPSPWNCEGPWNPSEGIPWKINKMYFVWSRTFKCSVKTFANSLISECYFVITLFMWDLLETISYEKSWLVIFWSVSLPVLH